MIDDRSLRAISSAICLILIGCTSSLGGEPPGGETSQVPTEPAVATTSPTDTPLAPADELATARADSLTAFHATETVVALTPTRTPLPTRTPTITPTSTPTPSPTESVPLNEGGPWLVFLASTEPNGTRYLWAINADGTGLTRLTDERILTFEAQPVDSLENGVKIAYIAQSDWETRDIELKVITLPGGEVETVTPLLDETDDSEGFDIYNLTTAIDYGGLSWSPDGSRLAFVGVLDGESVDVYAYDVYGGTITRLTDGPSQAFYLFWSPDGRFVIHKGFEFVGMGGPDTSGVWAARADGLGAVSLIEGSGEGETGYTSEVGFYGWPSSLTLYLSRRDYEGNSDIRLVNVETGETIYVMEVEFTSAAYAKDYNTWLLTRSYSPEPEMTLILVQNGEMSELPGNLIYQVQWFDTYDLFIGMTVDGQVYAISPGGDITKLPISAEWCTWRPPNHIVISPDESLWAWHAYEFYGSESELWVGEPMAEPTLILSYDVLRVRDVIWSPDSQRLIFLTDQGLWWAERPGFEPVCVVEWLYADSWNGWGGVWVP